MESKVQRVEFTPPEGMTLPEGVGPGDEFDMVCSLRLEGDKLCLTKVGEAAMPGANEKSEASEEPSKPTYDGMIDGITESEKGA